MTQIQLDTSRVNKVERFIESKLSFGDTKNIITINGRILQKVSIPDLAVTEEESIELLNDIQTLRQISIDMAQMVNLQQDSINEINHQITTTETCIDGVINNLHTAVIHNSKTNKLMRLTGGLTGGSVIGGMAGIAVSGIGIVPGIILGAIGGSIVGFTVSKELNNYVDNKISHLIRMNRKFINKILNNNTLYNNYKIDMNELLTSSHNNSQIEDNLILNNLNQGVNCLEEVKTIHSNTLNQLYKQGDILDRNVKTIEIMQHELDTTGLLITRLKTYSIIYFLKSFIGSINMNNLTNIQHIIDSNQNSSTCEKSRYDSLLFISWQDIATINDFVLLQHHIWNGYRIVLINQNNNKKVIELYKLQTIKRQEALDYLNQIYLLLIKLFTSIKTNDIYKIIMFLPHIESMILEEAETTFSGKKLLSPERSSGETDASNIFLDEMREILLHQIQPINKGIIDQLMLQDSQITILDNNISKTHQNINRQILKNN